MVPTTIVPCNVPEILVLWFQHGSNQCPFVLLVKWKGRFGTPSIIITWWAKQAPWLINQPMGKGHLSKFQWSHSDLAELPNHSLRYSIADFPDFAAIGQVWTKQILATQKMSWESRKKHQNPLKIWYTGPYIPGLSVLSFRDFPSKTVNPTAPTPQISVGRLEGSRFNIELIKSWIRIPPFKLRSKFWIGSTMFFFMGKNHELWTGPFSIANC